MGRLEAVHRDGDVAHSGRLHATGGVGGEEITVHDVPLPEAPAWVELRVAEGLLVDPKVYAGLYFATR